MKENKHFFDYTDEEFIQAFTDSGQQRNLIEQFSKQRDDTKNSIRIAWFGVSLILVVAYGLIWREYSKAPNPAPFVLIASIFIVFWFFVENYFRSLDSFVKILKIVSDGSTFGTGCQPPI